MLELTLPAAAVGRTEPILVTGMYGEGNLLTVRYVDESTLVVGYDHWGAGGPGSAPLRFEPGSHHVMRITMPSLTTYSKPAAGARANLRVDWDGQAILDEQVAFHGRLPTQVFFGENPIGASASPVFRGMIRTPDGREPFGGPETYFTRAERLRVWLRAHPWRALGCALISAVAGAAFGWLAGSRWPRVLLEGAAGASNAAVQALDRRPSRNELNPAQLAARRRALGWFSGASLVATVGYAWVVTGSTFNFNYTEIFGVFYDYQAASFLQGRLDVPEEAIGPEAFESRGKLYGYFGPTPALLRLPLVAAGIAFGKMSRALMVLYFVGSLGAAYLILNEAMRRARPTDTASDESSPSGVAIGVLVGSAGLGSTLLFLGSRGLIFHEAITAGIAFALWSVWGTLRYLNDGRRGWVVALICGVLAVHARPPCGMFALTLLGCAAALRLAVNWRREKTMAALRPPLTVGALAVFGFLSLNGLAWLKFRTFDPAPLRISRPYAMPGRLEHIDGRSFHLVNIPYNVDTYLLRPNFRFEETFPWFYLVSKTPPREFPRAKIDLADHTLAVPYAMPSLFALATVGCLGAALLRPGTRAPILLLWVAVLPMALALLAAVATAQRYTGDFVPFLIAAAAFGLAATETAPPGRRLALRGLLVTLTVVAIAINSALTLHYQGEVLWGVPEEARQSFQRIRAAADRWLAY